MAEVKAQFPTEAGNDVIAAFANARGVEVNVGDQVYEDILNLCEDIIKLGFTFDAELVQQIATYNAPKELRNVVPYIKLRQLLASLLYA